MVSYVALVYGLRSKNFDELLLLKAPSVPTNTQVTGGGSGSESGAVPDWTLAADVVIDGVEQLLAAHLAIHSTS